MIPLASVRIPRPATLKKYGLSLPEWLRILADQGGTCAVCGLVPSSGRLCTDHEHVRNWKKMPPERRKTYVRGVLCFVCNHYYVGRAISIAKARNVVAYLERYEARKAA